MSLRFDQWRKSRWNTKLSNLQSTNNTTLFVDTSQTHSYCLERHHVTIMVSKTYRMSRRAEYQLFSWHTDGDEHFGGMSVLLDAIKCGILSMKHFLLRIRNQTPDLRIPRLDALSLEYRDSLWRACSLFGSVANGFESYTVNSCCNTGHFFFFFLVSGFASS